RGARRCGTDRRGACPPPHPGRPRHRRPHPGGDRIVDRRRYRACRAQRRTRTVVRGERAPCRGSAGDGLEAAHGRRPGVRDDRHDHRVDTASRPRRADGVVLLPGLPPSLREGRRGVTDPSSPGIFDDVDDVVARFDDHDHLLDQGTAAAIHLAVALGRPLLLEGEPGVGKTTAAKVLAQILGSPLIRLQCYEGLSVAEALYDWNYQRQLLAIRLAEARGEVPAEADLYSEDYLLERPVLRCVRHRGDRPAVLLVDEIDRADDEFEALLLEFLGEFAVTVPELGTLTAARPPVVVLTSNRSRDLHDALRRRCVYHWIDYPEPARAVAIVRR